MGRHNSEDFEPVAVPGSRGLRLTPSGNLVVRVPAGARGQVALDGTREIVVAQKLIHDDSDVHEPGTEGRLIISRWLAEREGLEYEERRT